MYLSLSLTVYVCMYLSMLINLEGWKSENEIVRAVTRSGFSRISRFYRVRYAKCKLNVFRHFTICFNSVSSVFLIFLTVFPVSRFLGKSFQVFHHYSDTLSFMVTNNFVYNSLNHVVCLLPIDLIRPGFPFHQV